MGLQVGIVACALGKEPLLCPGGDGYHRQARGHSQSLLRAGDGDVNVPLIGEELIAADGGYAVYYEHRIVLLRQPSHLFRGVGQAY